MASFKTSGGSERKGKPKIITVMPADPTQHVACEYGTNFVVCTVTGLCFKRGVPFRFMELYFTLAYENPYYEC